MSLPEYVIDFARMHLDSPPELVLYAKRLFLQDPRLRPKDKAEGLLALEASLRARGLKPDPLPGEPPVEWSELEAGWRLEDLLQALGQSPQPTSPTSPSPTPPNQNPQAPS